ncbi:MAG TPA: DNA mismatch repair protein MutS [Limnochordales bacterium]
MLRQYQAFKAAYPDALLLFRLGDFYELFGRDAEIGAAILNITLTSREIGKGRRLPMCGVPYHAADAYIAQLVQAGYRVAICEQMEDPRLARGIVRREVIRVVTPGTLPDAAGRDRRYVAALWVGDRAVGLAMADVFTGELRATRLAADSPLGQELWRAALDELVRLAVDEVVVPPRLADDARLAGAMRQTLRAAVTRWDSPAWSLDGARRTLQAHFRTATLDAFGIEDWPEAQVAAGAVLQYLLETQKDRLVHITTLQSYDPRAGLALDATTALNLELTTTLRQRTRKGSLLDVLDRTLTAAGARLLRRYLEEPLTDVAAIRARLDAVEALATNHLARQRLRDALQGMPDAERLLGRAGTGRATPKDLLSLRHFLERLDEIRRIAAEVGLDRLPALEMDALEQSHAPLAALADHLARAIADDAPAQVRDGGYIREGYDAELDALRRGAEEGRRWIAGLEGRERERTGIRSLKVGFNRVFGYYIEVTRPNLKLVPPDYERRQTLTGAERFVTAELKEWESRVLEAEERIQQREAEIFQSLVERVLEHAAALQAACRAVARLDVAASLADLAVERAWVRPQVDEGPVIDIRQGRHPVVEAMMPDQPFVPNDLYLDMGARRVAIVTGPNMGGKSTFLRQAALLVLLAQMGSFVPARSARIGVVDRILSRVGASDDLASGRSTFMVEMSESAYILRHATPRSLVILDEVGRGTATYDGLSLAWAIVEALQERGCRTLVATHYHELTELEGRLEGVFNLHAAVAHGEDGIVFLRQIRPGAADRSYGIEVARLAGLPERVIERATEVLAHLEGSAPSASRVAEEALADALVPARETALDLSGPEAVGTYGTRPASRRPRPRARPSVADLAQSRLFEA